MYGYTNNSWGDLLTQHGSSAYTYDGIGNLLSDGTRTFTWKHGRQLTSMTDASGGVWTFTYDANGMRLSKRSAAGAAYGYVYNGSQLTQMIRGTRTYEFTYDASGTPMTISENGIVYYYVTNLQGDVVALLNTSGEEVVRYTYDAWGKLLTATGSQISGVGTNNPLRYRGYVYDHETELYYLQSRYYDPNLGRFINADALVSTGQGIIGNNMFAYCSNNPVCLFDPAGYVSCRTNTVVMCDGDSGYGPNIKYLMAFFGVDSPNQVPDLPEGAMIFVENITSVSHSKGVGVVSGRTIVMDAYKYCEYTFTGVGGGISRSMFLDRTITQGYVYGVDNVSDYCGLFAGCSFNMLSTVGGGAIAINGVYAKIAGGMSYAPSLGASVTWYKTSQVDWIYGCANMVILTNPYSNYPHGSDTAV